MTTTGIAETFSCAGAEDLAITHMVKSAKGTVEATGTRVRQKAGLNRAVAREAWGTRSPSSNTRWPTEAESW
ncbi:hypothetical protein [Streptomyces chartreusis]|uniref:Transposase n=1 Tax=Streptomyces chartreusis TaxID=1969 RepID=A0A7I0Y8V3_STRCX|nr:hypothetical protein [Streptomyces chartreusis]QKZ15934.1 hypothetical protein HUT05_42350 [Streptomyces chartreusis]